MLFAVFFALWRFLQLITLVRCYSFLAFFFFFTSSAYFLYVSHRKKGGNKKEEHKKEKRNSKKKTRKTDTRRKEGKRIEEKVAKNPNQKTPKLTTTIPSLPPFLTDPHNRSPRILRRRLQPAERAHTDLDPRALHRLRPRRRLGPLHAARVPPVLDERDLRSRRRRVIRRGVYRRRLCAPLHRLRRLHPRCPGVRGRRVPRDLRQRFGQRRACPGR